MIVRDILADSTAKLQALGIENPSKDARILLAHAMECDPSRLLLMYQEEVPNSILQTFDNYLKARLCFQPVSQIIGGREFWGRWFNITRDVLDPRPETETLIEIVLEKYAPRSILDLGTGSGVLAITLALERPETNVIATDVSHEALIIAKANAVSHNVLNQITFVQSDWFTSVSGQYDLIVSNPPYISELEMESLAPDVRDWEPRLALTPGGDGLSAYRNIAENFANFLNPDGILLLEIGTAQANSVTQIFSKKSAVDISVVKDLGGHDRILVVQSEKMAI